MKNPKKSASKDKKPATKTTKKSAKETPAEPKVVMRKIECLDCGGKFWRKDMTSNKKLCLPCGNARTYVSKRKKAEGETLNIPDTPPTASPPLPESLTLDDAFDSRDALSVMLKGKLTSALSDADDMITFQKSRLQTARESGSAKLINEAAKGLESAQKRRDDLCTRLMDKLEAMEDLRRQEAKTKPVTFFMVASPDTPIIKPTFTVPEDLYPVDDKKRPGEIVEEGGNE